MAEVTILHWNIETYGPGKFTDVNNQSFVNYIARLLYSTNTEIFSMIEVKNSISPVLPPLIADALNTTEGIAAAQKPWRWVRINSGYNNEAYIIMYRADRDFLPARSIGGAPGVNFGENVIPDHGLCRYDTAGLEVNHYPVMITVEI